MIAKIKKLFQRLVGVDSLYNEIANLNAKIYALEILTNEMIEMMKHLEKLNKGTTVALLAQRTMLQLIVNQNPELVDNGSVFVISSEKNKKSVN